MGLAGHMLTRTPAALLRSTGPEEPRQPARVCGTVAGMAHSHKRGDHTVTLPELVTCAAHPSFCSLMPHLLPRRTWGAS